MWIALSIALALISGVLGFALFKRGRETRQLSKHIEADIKDRVDGWVAQAIQRRKEMSDEELMEELMSGPE